MEDYYKVRKFIAEEFNITPESISEGFLDQVVQDARKCFAYIMVRYYCMSYVSTGKLLGNKHHSTVLNYLRKYHSCYDMDRKFKKKADEILSFVKIHISQRPHVCPFCSQQINNNTSKN